MIASKIKPKSCEPRGWFFYANKIRLSLKIDNINEKYR